MINHHSKQHIAINIKQQTWKLYTSKYQKKYKKPWGSNYTVIASISLVDTQQNIHKLVSLGFGTKSLPQSVVLNNPQKGELLSDMHAQILAIQGFKKFLLQNMGKEQYFLKNSKRQKYYLKQKWQVWLYCSEIFCGDCCINQENQSFSGAKPLKYLSIDKYPQLKYQSSILRTKPGRLDLPKLKRSAVLSCSDKLAFNNLVGIQGIQLFSFFFPIYLNVIIVESQQVNRLNITRGLDFVIRLSHFLNRKQQLVQRQLFNIVIGGKQKKVSSQFKRNRPQIIILESNKKQTSRDQEGFQMCGVFTTGQEQWINGRTGLPEGNSLKNYKTKGKVSQFCQAKLKLDYQNYRISQQSFKWKAVERRCEILWKDWISPE